MKSIVQGAAAENALKHYAIARKAARGESLPHVPLEKATSASDMAEQLADEYGLDFSAMGFATEMPEWLLEATKDRLDETFMEEYWFAVNDVTATEIEYQLAAGIEQGMSMREIASAIGELAPEYAGYRAMNVARTEIGNAMNYGHVAAIEQLNDETGMDFGKEWISVCGATTREDHCNLDGATAPIDGTFQLGDEEARWPGDELLSAGQRINCQCVPSDTLVSPVGALLAVSKMLYDGPLVELVTASGLRLKITPNHPVLSAKGWIAACQLKAGMHVLSKRVASHVSATKDIQHKPISIENIFQSVASVPTRIERSRRFAFQFHGDAEHGQGEVEAVVVDIKLPLPSAAEILQNRLKQRLELAACKLSRATRLCDTPSTTRLPRQLLSSVIGPKYAVTPQNPLNDGPRHSMLRGDGNLPFASKIRGNDGLLIDDSASVQVHSSTHRFGVRAKLHSGSMEPLFNYAAVAPNHLRDLAARLALIDVQPDEIVHVNVIKRFAGHVFDLQTTRGMYQASGIVVHNCTLISGLSADELTPDGERSIDDEFMLKWDEADHPRDGSGRFTSGGGTDGSEHSGAGDKPAGSSDTGRLRDDGGVGGGRSELGQAGKADPLGTEPLKGSPREANVPGIGKIKIEPFLKARQAAADYMAKAGLEYDPPKEYAKVDKERAKKIADAYEAMPHAPSDPEVQAAYKALADETIAQYEAAVAAGLKVDFIDMAKTGDPYAQSPRLAIEDIKNNHHMWVFATRDGFGSSQDFDPSENPLLAESGHSINGQPALVNDLFRIVHDYFGHAKEGNGMRADGEENAWRMHSAMFSPLARRAMTTETRGQNSWVNFGPKADSNQTATAGETTYADQKTGLLPEWVMTEGAKSLGIVINKDWNEADHPRDALGRWTDGSESIDGEPAGDKPQDGVPHDQPDQEYFGFDEGKREPRDPLEQRDNPTEPISKRAERAIRRGDALLAKGIEDGTKVAAGPASWDELDDSTKESAQQSWEEDNYDTYSEQAYTTWRDEMEDEAKTEAEDYVTEDIDGATEWIKDKLEELGYDRDAIEVNGVSDDYIQVDTESLKWADPDEHEGIDPIAKYKADHEDMLDTEWSQEFESRVDWRRDELIEEKTADGPPDHITESIYEDLSDAWGDLSDEQKLEAAGVDASEEIDLEEPDSYEPLSGESSGEDYKKTQAIARYLQKEISAQEMEYRGIDGADSIDQEALAEKLWSAWKGSSTEPLGLLLQVATARELGGNIQEWPPERLGKALDAAAQLSRYTGETRPTGFSGWTQEQKDKWHTERGLKIAEAHVHGTWAASQHILDKAGMSELPTYRAIILEKADVAKEPQQDIEIGSGPRVSDRVSSLYTDNYKKLTDIKILRNGAASTSTDVNLTNSWGGVGTSHIKEPQRVVLRIQAPKESIVSIPAFGQNVHSEQEIVLAGTNDWKAWDAWVGRAPPAERLTIKSVGGIMQA